MQVCASSRNSSSWSRPILHQQRGLGHTQCVHVLPMVLVATSIFSPPFPLGQKLGAKHGSHNRHHQQCLPWHNPFHHINRLWSWLVQNLAETAYGGCSHCMWLDPCGSQLVSACPWTCFATCACSGPWLLLVVSIYGAYKQAPACFGMPAALRECTNQI